MANHCPGHRRIQCELQLAIVQVTADAKIAAGIRDEHIIEPLLVGCGGFAGGGDGGFELATKLGPGICEFRHDHRVNE